MSCATCGCLAFTISRQSAQLPQKASGLQSPGSPLRMCNTSHKYWRTKLSWTLAYSAVNSGGTVLNQELARVAAQNVNNSHAICVDDMRNSLEQEGLFLSLLVQLCCNVLRVANWNTKDVHLVLRRPTWDLLSTRRLRGGSLELLLSKRLQLGASNLRCSRSSSCPGLQQMPLKQQVHLPDPGGRTDDVNVVQKGKQSFTFKERSLHYHRPVLQTTLRGCRRRASREAPTSLRPPCP